MWKGQDQIVVDLQVVGTMWLSCVVLFLYLNKVQKSYSFFSSFCSFDCCIVSVDYHLQHMLQYIVFRAWILRLFQVEFVIMILSWQFHKLKERRNKYLTLSRKVFLNWFWVRLIFEFTKDHIISVVIILQSFIILIHQGMMKMNSSFHSLIFGYTDFLQWKKSFHFIPHLPLFKFCEQDWVRKEKSSLHFHLSKF